MLEANDMNINNGIFQGESPFPLLRIARVALSIELENTNYKNKTITKKVNQ